jgi:hypothetical protein
MRFRVGDIVAKCLKCGGTVFEPSGENLPGRPHSNFRCGQCKAAASYSELMAQIGKESARRTKIRLTSPQRADSALRLADDVRPGAAALVLRNHKLGAG